MKQKDYLIVPLGGSTPKSVFKDLASRDTILSGYRRFVMPHGKNLLSKEEALTAYDNHHSQDKIHRKGTSFLLILDTGDLFFYVDHETSPPSMPTPVYEVRLDLKGVEYVYEVPTFQNDAVEFALADLYSRVGDVVRSAQVVSVVRVARKPPEARGPF